MLVPGQKVFVLEAVGRELYGRVDAVTEDGAVLWLHMDAGAGRRLFTRTEDGRVWRLTGDPLPGC